MTQSAQTLPPEPADIEQPPLWVVQRAARLRAARRRSAPSDVYRPGRDDLPEAERFQLQFHKARHVIRAMFLGNGSGKTTVAGIEADWWMQHKHPFQETPTWPVQVIWVALKYAQVGMLREQLESTCLTPGFTFNETKHLYKWANGSEMWIVSNDGDWSTIQGINPDLIIVDEECDDVLWRELQMRRRGRKDTRYVISATATKGKRWMYHDVYEPWLATHEAAGLTEDQAMHDQRDKYRWVWPKGGIADNPIHTPEQLDWYVNQVAYRSPAEKQIRLKGGFMDLNASPVFNPEGLDAIEAWLKEDGNVGRVGILLPFAPAPGKNRRRPKALHEFEFIPNGEPYEGGRITIYEEPVEDATYVIGADFANGLPTGDFDGAIVLRKGEFDNDAYQAATAHGRWGDQVFSYVLFALGWYYNEALICGERNNTGLAAMRRLYDEMGYVYQFHQEVQPGKAHTRKSDLLGYNKTAGCLVIPRLQWAVAPVDGKGGRLPPRVWLRDPALLDEMRRYQYAPRSKTVELADAHDFELKMGAPRGYHDDLVNAAGGSITGWIELPRFRRPAAEYAPGSLGQILKHKEVLQPPKRKSAFSLAKGAKEQSRVLNG
jgi:hypothetical protein